MNFYTRDQFAPTRGAAALADEEMGRHGTPREYIRGHVEKFGRRFNLDRRAYVPNDETEHLVRTALRYIASDSFVVEAGTGCGWQIITVNLESGASTAAVDIEHGALELAAENMIIYGIEPVPRMPETAGEAGLFRSSHVHEIPIDEPDFIIADYPYGSDDYILHPEGKIRQAQMPRTSVYPPDGSLLGCYRELIDSIERRGWHPRVFLETGIMPVEQVRSELQSPRIEYHRISNYSVTEIDMR